MLVFTFASDNPFLSSTVMKKTYHIKKQDDGESICETIDSFVTPFLCGRAALIVLALSGQSWCGKTTKICSKVAKVCHPFYCE